MAGKNLPRSSSGEKSFRIDDLLQERNNMVNISGVPSEKDKRSSRKPENSKVDSDTKRRHSLVLRKKVKAAGSGSEIFEKDPSSNEETNSSNSNQSSSYTNFQQSPHPRDNNVSDHSSATALAYNPLLHASMQLQHSQGNALLSGGGGGGVISGPYLSHNLLGGHVSSWGAAGTTEGSLYSTNNVLGGFFHPGNLLHGGNFLIPTPHPALWSHSFLSSPANSRYLDTRSLLERGLHSHQHNIASSSQFASSYGTGNNYLSSRGMNSMLSLGGSNKRKGGQIRFTNSQTSQLEKAFREHKYLNANDRKTLAHSLGLSDKQVKTWFQNRRAKHRKCKDGGYYDSAKDADHSAGYNSTDEDPDYNVAQAGSGREIIKHS